MGELILSSIFLHIKNWLFLVCRHLCAIIPSMILLQNCSWISLDWVVCGTVACQNVFHTTTSVFWYLSLQKKTNKIKIYIFQSSFGHYGVHCSISNCPTIRVVKQNKFGNSLGATLACALSKTTVSHLLTSPNDLACSHRRENVHCSFLISSPTQCRGVLFPVV